MLSLKIVSSEDTLFDGAIDFVVLPGSEGQLGILTNHAPLLSTLKEGRITVRQNDKRNTLGISGGFVEVLKDKVTVLIS